MTLFGSAPQLWVSLPRNDADLARAAAAAGADGVKTHINVAHRASGTGFGSVTTERAALSSVLEVGLPTGLVVGGEGAVTRAEIDTARSMGFAFFDVYLHHAPAWYVDACAPVPAVAALGADAPLDQARAMATLGFAAVEASFTPPEQYHTPLYADRVADYARLAACTPLPVVIPSQHALTPDDVPALLAAGVSALLIGAVVTGTTPNQLRQVTAAFRAAIDTEAPRSKESKPCGEPNPFMRLPRCWRSACFWLHVRQEAGPTKPPTPRRLTTVTTHLLTPTTLTVRTTGRPRTPQACG